ncbi:MAG TPA: hypothetical protein VN704_06670 [Verrucomicrobiae bacterium]|nr:hypothetical protein [Verrucomicrobiae bacterium]
MFSELFSLVFNLGLLGFIPASLTILGGFLDYGNKDQGNFRNDIPSTLGLIIGIIIDLYIIWNSTAIIILILLFLSGYFMISLDIKKILSSNINQH